MTPAGIERATFKFVAQHLNHCATAVPCIGVYFCYLVKTKCVCDIPASHYGTLIFIDIQLGDVFILMCCEIYEEF